MNVVRICEEGMVEVNPSDRGGGRDKQTRIIDIVSKHGLLFGNTGTNMTANELGKGNCKEKRVLLSLKSNCVNEIIS